MQQLVADAMLPFEVRLVLPKFGGAEHHALDVAHALADIDRGLIGRGDDTISHRVLLTHNAGIALSRSRAAITRSGTSYGWAGARFHATRSSRPSRNGSQRLPSPSTVSIPSRASPTRK